MNLTAKLIKCIVTSVHLILTLFATSSLLQAAGELDATFDGGAFRKTGRNIHVAKKQADGKLLIAGTFEVANGQLRYLVARLNPDSTIDKTFSPPKYLQGNVRALAIQSDGKILVGGNILIPLVTDWVYMIRLNTDGSVDNTFSTISTSQDPNGNTNVVRDIEIASDGRLLIAGNFSYSNASSGGTRTKFARLNPDGTTDTSFSPAGLLTDMRDIELQPDSKIVGVTTDGGSGNRFIKRFNPDGLEDPTFTALVTGTVNALKIQPDGKILIVGEFTFVNNVSRVDAARLETGGALDPTFAITTGSVGFPVGSYLNDVEFDVNGKILLGGVFSRFNGDPRNNFARVDANGNFDGTLSSALNRISEGVNVILPLPDGGVFLSVSTPAFVGGVDDKVIHLDVSGSRDDSFSALVGWRGIVSDVIVQPDGKILVAGDLGALGSFAIDGIGRFNADGSPDTGFRPLPLIPNTPLVTAIALQPDGKILIGGAQNTSYPLKRLNADGSPDSTFFSYFDTASSSLDIALRPDGKFMTVGKTNGNWVTRRFEASGAGDGSFHSPTFTAESNLELTRVLVQPDGKVLVAGNFTAVSGTPRGRIARLNVDGSLDLTFNPLGGANAPVNEMGLQSDGKILIAGNFLGYNGTNRNYFARLNADGSLDEAFTTSPNNIVRAIKIEPNGKIIIGGDFTSVNGVGREKITRLNADGTLDLSFNIGTGIGIYGTVHSLALQPDNNKVVVGGNFTHYNEVPAVSIVRLLNSSAPSRTLFDFDGDGRSDVAVFRPSSGDWYQLLSGNGGYNVLHFGQSGDRVAPADYDGDGRTDVAIFRDTVPGGGNTAYFYITKSSNGSVDATQFGSTGDIPVNGDWDGDGKADLAVYRDGSASGGQSYFYYRPSGSPSVNFTAIPWGATGDKPLFGDFDGDGKLDVAVFRPSIANWFILKSSNGQFIQQAYGLSTDIPTPADFDGDGTTNVAVFRPSTGFWYTSMDPQTNYGGVQFGTSGDAPVPADYDGDSRADVAIFRPSDGLWYILRSTQGFTAVNFGIGGDKPIPNAFVP